MDDTTDYTFLGRYRRLSTLGSGGFALVFLAYDTKMQRKVAIKCMPIKSDSAHLGATGRISSVPDASILLDRIPANRLQKYPGISEARCAAMLRHANIATVYDFDIYNNEALIISEHVDGLNLEQLIDILYDNQTHLDIDAITYIFKCVSDAIIFAHENQVLHLDIKPANILIDVYGEVKVVDFGLATYSSANGYSSAIGGTVGYMPPEQIQQQNPDERCDEWALASVLYELLTLYNPFLAQDLKRALKAIDGAVIDMPSSVRHDVCAEIDSVLMYALQPNREDRYDTVLDFSEEALAFLGDANAGKAVLAEKIRDCVSE